jgi:2-polyprenyl-3-methyl-5-hydroxy-6-metoxy-1,4-benzoquinol methylase
MDPLLAEQAEYYRERAPEYDDWWLRTGAYATDDAAFRDAWFADVAEAEAALEEFRPAGEVLDLACGTGLWTRRLVRHASHVTAVDAAAEVIALNRARLPAAPVTYVQADLFDWQPPAGRYDVCAMTYWLSHVPAARLPAIWSLVDRALTPGGRVFVVDSTIPGRYDADGEVERRQLTAGGREFRVVKRYERPETLTGWASRHGWELQARLTANGMILYATGRRAPQNPG